MQSFWRSFLSIINACKDHGIPYYIMQHNAKWQFENAINIVFLFLLSICPCPVAVKQFPDQCWMTSWRISSTANMTNICPFPIMALPTQVFSLLLLMCFGFFLLQPTVIGSFGKNILSLLQGSTTWQTFSDPEVTQNYFLLRETVP